jgi:hypothetical protein
MLGALEALESGTTSIVDHHESPQRHRRLASTSSPTRAARSASAWCAHTVSPIATGPMVPSRGLAENERFLRAGGGGWSASHAAFTCTRRHARGGGRSRPRPRGRRAHPRRRGRRRRGRRKAPRNPR